MKRGKVLSSLSSILAAPLALAQYDPYASLSAEQLELIAQSNPEVAQQIAQLQTQSAGGVGNLAALGGAVIAIVAVIGIAVYIYIALALKAIAKKTNTPKDWRAWVPIADLFLLQEIAGAPIWTSWVATVGILVAVLLGSVSIAFPIVGWLAVAYIVYMWMNPICKKLGKPSWWTYVFVGGALQGAVSAINISIGSIFGLLGLASAIMLGIMAWGSSLPPAGVATAPQAQPIQPQAMMAVKTA